MGAPPEIIEQASKRKAKCECLVDEDCWESLQVFLGLSSQWRVVASMSGFMWLGINYQAVECYFRLSGIPKKKRQQIFADLQVMQSEAVEAINKRN